MDILGYNDMLVYKDMLGHNNNSVTMVTSMYPIASWIIAFFEVALTVAHN